MTSPTDTGTITTIHLILIVMFAIAAIAAILYGIRRANARRASGVSIEKRAADAPTAPPPLADDPVSATSVSAPEPIGRTSSPTRSIDASPAVEAAQPGDQPAGVSPADGPVTQLKGLGPKLAEKLADLGVITVGQLAALDEDEAQTLDAQLGAFTGRLQRDRWIEQARFLAAGDRAGFEAVFGKL